MVIGYTTGVFDLFHVGHLNILRNAKSMCDHLIVGVSTDELVAYKFKKAVVPFEERMEIVRGIKFVDTVVPQENMDKLAACKKMKVSKLFVGDDWFQSPKWEKIEQELLLIGCEVVYFPYTKTTSSTLITETLLQLRKA